MKELLINNENVSQLMNSINNHKNEQGALIPILHEAQDIFGCVPLEVQKIISKETGISVAKINGVVTFYSYFSTEPVGDHTIEVCLGTSCYLRGGQKVLDEVCKILQIMPGETTECGTFTVQVKRCHGHCDRGPTILVDGNYYDHVTLDQIPEIIDCYRK